MAAKKKEADPEAPPLPAAFKPWMLDALEVSDMLVDRMLEHCEQWLPGKDTDHAEYVDQIFDGVHKMKRRVRDVRRATNKLPDA